MPYVAELINHIRDRICESAYLVTEQQGSDVAGMFERPPGRVNRNQPPPSRVRGLRGGRAGKLRTARLTRGWTQHCRLEHVSALRAAVPAVLEADTLANCDALKPPAAKVGYWPGLQVRGSTRKLPLAREPDRTTAAQARRRPTSTVWRRSGSI